MPETMSPLQFFVPFDEGMLARADDEKRIVEGCVWGNGRVASDKYNLPLPVLQRASAAYMEYPALREMHQPMAAGSTLAFDFTEADKAMIRVFVDDDTAWRKVKNKTYRGFSLGGRPKGVIRADGTMEDFELIEISLVDRPADPKAKITIFRVDVVDAPVAKVAEVPEVVRDVALTAPVAVADGSVEAVVRTDAPKPYGDVEYADPEHGRYPIDNEQHVRAAWSYINQADNADKFSADELKSIRAKIISAGKKFGIDFSETADGNKTDDATARVDDPDITRGITSADAPSRQNLEDADKPKPDGRKVKAMTHYDCGADGDCHGHVTRGGAYECMVKRGDTTLEIARVALDYYPNDTPVTQHFNNMVQSLRAEANMAQIDSACRSLAMSLLWTADTDEQHENIDQFAAYLHAWLDKVATDTARRADINTKVNRLSTAEVSDSDHISNFQRLETERAELTQRMETLDAELTIARADTEEAKRLLEAEKEEVKRLRATPLNGTGPVAAEHLVAVERTFTANGTGNGPQDAIARLRADRDALVQTARGDTLDNTGRQLLAAKLIRIERQLNELGAAV